MNRVILVGNICNELELKVNGEVKTLNFNLAAQKKFKNKETNQYESDFIRVVAFNNLADFISNYFSKGSKIAIDGRIQTRTWDDDQGIKHYVTEVVAENAEFVGSKKQDNNTTENNSLENENNQLSSDLPF